MRIGRLRVVVVAALALVLSLAGSAPPAVAGGVLPERAGPKGVLLATVLGFGDDPGSVVGQPVSGAKVVVVAARSGKVLATATSDSLGQVRMERVPAGPVKVRASAPGWLTTWAPGERRKVDAAVFRVPRRGVTDIGDVRIYRPASVQGQVLSSMDPVSYAKVTIFDASTHEPLRSVVSDVSGNYLVTGLYPGQIKVRASLAHYITNWADSFGQMTWKTARIFTLAPGALLAQSWTGEPSLYLDIAREAVIEGRVLGNGRPLARARVAVIDATTGKVVRQVTADRTGHYRVDRIGAFSGLTVKVRAAKPGWRTSWADGKWSKATADTFQLYPGVVIQQASDTGSPYLNLRRPAR